MKDIIKWIVYGCIFAIPFLTLYVENSYFFPYITGKNIWFRILVEVALAGYILLALWDKTYRPRFSWILTSLTALIGVMLIATIGAKHVPTAFWSNFERMDGYITLIHVFGYVMVLGGMMTSKKLWLWFLHCSTVAATMVAFVGLGQLASGTTGRVDSQLGNAAYMAVYMLFHIFFMAYLFVSTKVTPYRLIYTLLGVLFIYVLLQTGTRGTAIGLVTGSITTGIYALIYARNHPLVRRHALTACMIGLVVISAFVAFRHSDFIQDTPALARIANINLSNDLQIRSIIWGMSIEGIKERPIFGWGNGNFNYVFNQEYDPRLYAQEHWFDRVHNIVFDWLIAGGIVGFVTYVSVFIALAYYLLWRPFFGDQSFTVGEGAVLSGLVVGYITHNLVVFDNIVSYIFFAVLLAMVHTRVSQPIAMMEKIKVPEKITTQILMPAMVVVLIAVVYTLQVPNMYAARSIIEAYQEQNLDKRLDIFKDILASHTFARQEVVEQLAQQTITIVSSEDAKVTPEIKEKYSTYTESQLQALVAYKPGDARIHVFLSSYYRAIGDNDKAAAELTIARDLSPRKQAIILQQGAVAIAQGNNEAALPFFKEAFELDEKNDEAREYYVSMLYLTGNAEEARRLTEEGGDTFADRIANSDFYLSGANEAKDYEAIAKVYEKRVALDETKAQSWASLAFAYYQMKDISKAITTLEMAAEKVPSFKPTATCVINNLKTGKSPEIGCQ